MATDEGHRSDWERLLGAECHVQALLPDAVLVGGTAAALHAGHRRSMDGDHVLADLRDRFDEVLGALEAAAGWKTVMVLGSLDGIQTGIRQLRRTLPLETELKNGLRVPTLAEMARIKAWLLVTRNTVRDYLDTTVLLERLGEREGLAALASLDTLYEQPTGASVRAELVERLTAAHPGDLAQVELASYKGLVPPWNDWDYLAQAGRRWGVRLARALATEVSR